MNAQGWPSFGNNTISERTTNAMLATRVHIAGVGISSCSRDDLFNGAIEAGAKALLDAGITYAQVSLSIACSLEDEEQRIPKTCFKAFGKQKAPILLADSNSALYMASQCVRNAQSDCVMLIGLDSVRLLTLNETEEILTSQVGTCRPKWRLGSGKNPGLIRTRLKVHRMLRMMIDSLSSRSQWLLSS
jgi:hypothetical protein